MNGIMKTYMSLELLVWLPLTFSSAYVVGAIDHNMMSVEEAESIMAVSPIVGSEEYYLRTRELSKFAKIKQLFVLGSYHTHFIV